MAKAKYELLVDGRRHAKAADEDEVRTWLEQYRAEHEEDDPDATHVQVLKNSPGFFSTGELVPREDFFVG
ncbi:MAG TPA: hypothetical protein VEG24_04360 [Gaiellaceae bacterium]|nr:hypothetical protein [Gaiellaceae bacterium]